MHPPKPGDKIVSIDRDVHYDGRLGEIVAVADKENRGRTELRIQVQWEGRRNKTWLAASAEGKRWKRIDARELRELDARQRHPHVGRLPEGDR